MKSRRFLTAASKFISTKVKVARSIWYLPIAWFDHLFIESRTHDWKKNHTQKTHAHARFLKMTTM